MYTVWNWMSLNMLTSSTMFISAISSVKMTAGPEYKPYTPNWDWELGSTYCHKLLIVLWLIEPKSSLHVNCTGPVLAQ